MVIDRSMYNRQWIGGQWTKTRHLSVWIEMSGEWALSWCVLYTLILVHHDFTMYNKHIVIL